MKAVIQNPFVLRIGDGDAFHYRRRFEPTGSHPMATIPQPSQCLIARILHGAWLLSTIAGQTPACEVEFRAPSNHSFVAIELAAGEQVVINFHNFVGFLSGLQFQTHLTLNIASLTLSKILFQTATGPGILLMQARGVPRIWHDSGPIPPFSPARLMCWSPTSQFDLQGSDRAADIFLSPMYLNAKSVQLLVIDADEPDSTGSSHLWRMLKRFWKPL